jgi:hypothetical protein
MNTNCSWTEEFNSRNITDAIEKSISPLKMLNAFISNSSSVLSVDNIPAGLKGSVDLSILKIEG